MPKKKTPEVQLEQDELELLVSYEKGEWRRAKGHDALLARLQGTAAATLRKDRRVSIRLAERDVLSIQMRAAEEGMPYQTLIASILHKYVSGRLTETSE